LTNPAASAVTVTGLTLSVSGTGNPADITGVTLSANGVPVATIAFTGTTATFVFSDTTVGNSSVTYTVAANFGSNAVGTYNFSITNASGNNGQPLLFSGLPVAGAMVTISHPTTTPTATAQATGTPTPGASTPLVFPNPVQGPGPVTFQFTLPQSYGQAEVKVFTSAFRMVEETVVKDPSAGLNRVPLILEDKWGQPLANGLYYIVVQWPQGRAVTRLLILR